MSNFNELVKKLQRKYKFVLGLVIILLAALLCVVMIKHTYKIKPGVPPIKVTEEIDFFSVVKYRKSVEFPPVTADEFNKNLTAPSGMEKDYAKKSFLLSEEYRKDKKYDEAIDALSDVLKHVTPNSISAGQAYFNIGDVYTLKGDLKNADDNYKKAVEIFKTSKALGDLISALVNRAIIVFSRGNTKETANIFKSVVKISGEMEIIDPNIFHRMGVICYLLRDYERAIDYYEKSYEKDKTPISEVLYYSNMGSVYLQQKNYKEAEKFLSMARDVSCKYGFSETEISSLTELGTLHFLTKNHGVAKKYFNEAIELWQKTNLSKEPVPVFIGIAYDHLGQIYRNEGNYEEAENCHKQALNIFESMGYLYDQSLALVNLSNLYYERYEQRKDKEDLAQSINYLEDAVKIMRQIDHEDRRYFEEKLKQLKREFLLP